MDDETGSDIFDSEDERDSLKKRYDSCRAFGKRNIVNVNLVSMTVKMLYYKLK